MSTTQIIIAIAVPLALIAIVVYVKRGIDEVLEKEKRCIACVSAEVTSAYKYKMFGLEFYQVQMRYTVGGKRYETSKGYFKSKEPSKFLDLHVNPSRPGECYLTTAKEKCGKKYAPIK